MGICLGLNLEKVGYSVLGLDLNDEYVNSINNKTLKSNEPSVNEYLKVSKKFVATTNLKESLKNDIIFITVATPSLQSGKYDHSQIDIVVNQLIEYGIQPVKKYLIIGCTVMPTYCETVQNKLKNLNYEICYNPEFIAQGSIIKDQQYPDTILIGCSNNDIGNVVEDICKSMCKNIPRVHKMSLTEAEITKIALNCFLTTKIAYANMVGDISLSVKCDPNKILTAIGDDSRIGNKYLKYGFGFGGPCFPRDNRAFGIFCEENGIYPHISYATDQSNRSHLMYQVLKTVKDGVTNIVIENITYKPDSFILEESQQLKYALSLTENGINVTICERREIINKLKELYGNRFNYIVR